MKDWFCKHKNIFWTLLYSVFLGSLFLGGLLIDIPDTPARREANVRREANMHRRKEVCAARCGDESGVVNLSYVAGGEGYVCTCAPSQRQCIVY